MSDAANPRRRSGGTTIQITALDGIVNVNSLFTFAAFIGLAINPTDPNNTLITDQTCTPGPGTAEDMIAFHVYAFASFLFSSLIAISIKQAIRIAKSPEPHRIADFFARVDKTILRAGILVSGLGSVFGCGFLMLALVNVVQIKLGTLACGSSHTLAAVVPLVILVPLALLAFVLIILYAFTQGYLCRKFEFFKVLLAIGKLGAPKLGIWWSWSFIIIGIKRANGAGECGRSSPDIEAWKLAPCAEAAQDENAEVSDSCCAQVKKIGQNPKCLCAVMLSNTAKMSGANPEIAVTIPKRCNLADRPVGYKCGCELLLPPILSFPTLCLEEPRTRVKVLISLCFMYVMVV
ncbi:Bifunctional inhibitor/plant lipid transfer protein/seed storage helical domain [Dillenia turbinata]|uniref:Bifunctional inhibitor/plant lipid transfer protein/seed storage helical domain n=1 Tax=Dillenia turbinata TaxID=194707 RepID=A0AAN8Z982_9MAGN